MKKLICLLLSLVLLASAASALAETTIDPNASRSVSFSPAGANTAPAGTSPTTGRNLVEEGIEAPDGFVGMAVTGRYMPVIVQIDNSFGGLDARKKYDASNPEDGKCVAPWCGSYADVVYESPLYKKGDTRMSFLFNDLVPEYVAPIRSARLQHVWLREEWDSAFVHAGGQKYSGTSVYDEMTKLGVTKKGISFDGTSGGKAWNKYIYRTEKLTTPHNSYVMLAGLMTQVVPGDYVPATNHTWLFTDEVPEGGDEAEIINVTWGQQEYSSYLEYDEEENTYYRYMLLKPSKPSLYDEVNPMPNKTDEIIHNNPITFNNVIVQFVKIEWPRSNAPKPTVTGTGNAEYFMGGKHYSGVWNRETLQDRTVFYGMDGQEIQLQRGHTLIIMMDYETEGRSVSYE